MYQLSSSIGDLSFFCIISVVGIGSVNMNTHFVITKTKINTIIYIIEIINNEHYIFKKRSHQSQ